MYLGGNSFRKISGFFFKDRGTIPHFVTLHFLEAAFFVVVIENYLKNRFSKSSLKNEQSKRILKIEFALLQNKYAL